MAPTTTHSSARDAEGPKKPSAVGVDPLDRPPLMMIRRGGFLGAATQLDEEMLARFSPTRPIAVRLVQERHSGQHRLYWSLLTKVAESLPGMVTADHLHEWVKQNIDVTIYDHRTGELLGLSPTSIAFDVMDQPAWHDFFQRVLEAMITRIIPGLDKPALTREAAALIGFAA